MSIVVRFAPPSPASPAQYDETVRRLEGRLMPILADVGIQPGEPEVFEVHNTIRR